MIGGGGGRNGDGESSYETVVDLAMREMEKRKVFDLIGVGEIVRLENQERNESV